ncbi:DUF2252 domain-containing protein [Pseudonocardiaceae bacterium YIM PH 21723]|nr:DUF2252 domain-containing protein [Pseudonocardiaceae bacterium YIM PH 21723]
MMGGMTDVTGEVRSSWRQWTPPEDVRALGEKLRDEVPHEVNDHPAAAEDRPGVRDYISASNAGRVEDLVALRIGRMLVSPFSFLRGSAGLMAADLAKVPTSGLNAQICGDAHAANFGLYGGAAGRIVMDINDFDETIVGPWEWDLKRLAASLVLAGRDGGVSESDCLDAAQDSVRSYRRTLGDLAEQPFLESWTALTDDSAIGRAKADALLDDFEKASAKARRNTSAKVAAKWTTKGDEGWRFVPDPPVLSEVDDKTADQVIHSLDSYVDTLRESRTHLIARYRVADVAFRVVGTGSVGLRNYLLLMHGNRDDELVLQIKEVRPSQLAAYLPAQAERHEGERVVRGQRLMQADTDLLLGWTTVDGRPFIVRQFRNFKGDIDPTSLSGGHLDDYGRLAGALLARAHLRSVDPRLLAGYCAGSDLDEIIGTYAVRYADQAEADHAELERLVAAGVLPATTGV